RLVGRPDIAEGCREGFDWAFMKYVWRFHLDKRGELVRLVAGLRPDQESVVLRTPGEAKRWLAGRVAG
ncbi:MAG: hypothetical protein AAF612_05015, partial [Planctomycetota bacterium]